MSDAVELARNIQPLGYHDWLEVVEGHVFLACSECGLSHEIMLKNIGIDMQRIRVMQNAELTDATRETDILPLPLYREVLKLREDHAQLKRQVQDALQWIKEHGEPTYHGVIENLLTGENHFDGR